MEARIQTGALPAVGWSVLLCLLIFGERTFAGDYPAANHIEDLVVKHNLEMLAVLKVVLLEGALPLGIGYPKYRCFGVTVCGYPVVNFFSGHRIGFDLLNLKVSEVLWRVFIVGIVVFKSA